MDKDKTIGEKLSEESNIYFNVNPIFCWQRLLYFIIGTRGVGKTYGCVKRGIKHYIKDHKKGKRNKRQFMYVRRTEVELDSVDTLFNPFITILVLLFGRSIFIFRYPITPIRGKLVLSLFSSSSSF